MISRFTGVNTLADSFGRVTGLFGHTSSDSYNNFNPTTSVTTASAGLFTAAPRELDDPNLEHPTDANLAPKSLDLQHLALFVDTTNPTPTVTSHADSSKRALASGGDDDHGGGHDDAVKSVNWNTDVFIQSGQSPELVVSAPMARSSAPSTSRSRPAPTPTRPLGRSRTTRSTSATSSTTTPDRSTSTPAPPSAGARSR